jgi:hypothetical protein
LGKAGAGVRAHRLTCSAADTAAVKRLLLAPAVSLEAPSASRGSLRSGSAADGGSAAASRSALARWRLSVLPIVAVVVVVVEVLW